MKIKNGILFSIEDSDIINGEFTTPADINSIECSACLDNDNLVKLYITGNVEYVGANAFSQCISLEMVVVE